MKNFCKVQSKIRQLSKVTGLPVYYASDLNIWCEALKEYEGERFLLILRIHGAQCCLLDNKDEAYYTMKLDEFKFYYSQVRDAQFYYYDGKKLAAVDPFEALKMIAQGKELVRPDLRAFELEAKIA